MAMRVVRNLLYAWGYAHLMESVGIICTATSQKYFNMFLMFAEYLRKYESHIDVILFTDTLREIPDEYRIVQRILPSLENNWDDKIYSLELSPFDVSIYIDVDTIVVNPFVTDITEAMQYADLIIRSGMCFNIEEEKIGFPVAISQFNTGVFAIRQKKVPKFVSTFRKFRIDYPPVPDRLITDQVPFRMAALECHLRISELPSDFNFMGGFNCVVDSVRILHFAGAHHFLSDKIQIKKIHDQFKFANGGSYAFYWKIIYTSRHFYIKNILTVLSVDVYNVIKFWIFRHFAKYLRKYRLK